MSTATMDQITEAQDRAWQYAARSNPKLPDPREIIPLLCPMTFKQRRKGPYKIEPETSDMFPVTNQRMQVLMGTPLVNVRFDGPTSFHLLKKGKQILTSDKPIEIYQQWLSFRQMRGRVLVGGLGLGMAATMILNSPEVRSVTIVEKSKAIIDLIKPQVSSKFKIIHDDLFDFLKALRRPQYESAYFDIWYGTGESDWSANVLPLYRAARRKGILTLGAWGEYEMNWQLRSGLHKAAFLEAGWTFLPYVLWRRGLKDHFKALPVPEDRLQEVESLLELYLNGIGGEQWERIWGRAADVLVPK